MPNAAVTPAPAARPSALPATSLRQTTEKSAASDADTAIGDGASCPKCRARLGADAITCAACGHLLLRNEESSSKSLANCCPNPECGAAHSPAERRCRRCDTPLLTPPGTVLCGRYRIEQHIAVGGFGAVYRARDLGNGGVVAIKDMIAANASEYGTRLTFFRREAAILRALQHHAIVPRVFDLIESAQTAYLILEYIDGQDLLQILELRRAPFPVHQVVQWGMEVCDVLSDMHAHVPPLLHRDLKPDNLMLLLDQQTLKMIDFGSARDAGRPRRQRKASMTRVYTEGYAPPEQIIGKPEPRSDLFALAGTLYHLATGEPPEGATTSQELAARLAH
jgi:serine/threonine protein kinase